MVKGHELEIVVDAIKTRRELCSEDLKNIEDNSFNKLKKIFTTDINSLTLNDIMQLSPNNRGNLIELVGLSENFFNFEEESGYLELFKVTQDYIKVNKDRSEKIKEVLRKCDMYEEVLTINSKNHDLLPSLIDFASFLDSLGSLNAHDKQVALRRVNEYNLEANILDPEIRQGVNYTVSEINQHKDIQEIIINYIKDNKLRVDLNFIPTYAKQIANEFNQTPELVEGVMFGMILEQEAKKFEQDQDSIHLVRMNRLLNEYKYDDMKVLIGEANRIIRHEMSALMNSNPEIRDIVIEESQTEEEFEDKKQQKMIMLAALIKREIENYENSTNRELKDKHKELLLGFVNEYHNVKGMVYKQVQGRSL